VGRFCRFVGMSVVRRIADENQISSDVAGVPNADIAGSVTKYEGRRSRGIARPVFKKAAIARLAAMREWGAIPSGNRFELR
jgi:hypothetical protein